jgi:SAM-dependent methyltransferase
MHVPQSINLGPGCHSRAVTDEFERFGLGAEDRAAWEASGRPQAEFGEWLLDRVARRPAGARARAVYGAEDVHDFARRAILAALSLRPGDRLLEIGCGGGLLLRDALATGARVTGLDHSEEMVRLAGELAPAADVVPGSAEALPFGDAAFTAVAMSVVFIFLPEPLTVLRECRRVLAPGGRLAVFTTGAELRGTPAAPEPFASRAHFHTDEALAALAREAGFTGAAVANDGGGQLLTATA